MIQTPYNTLLTKFCSSFFKTTTWQITIKFSVRPLLIDSKQSLQNQKASKAWDSAQILFITSRRTPKKGFDKFSLVRDSDP